MIKSASESCLGLLGYSSELDTICGEIVDALDNGDGLQRLQLQMLIKHLDPSHVHHAVEEIGEQSICQLWCSIRAASVFSLPSLSGLSVMCRCPALCGLGALHAALSVPCMVLSRCAFSALDVCSDSVLHAAVSVCFLSALDVCSDSVLHGVFQVVRCPDC